MKLHSDGYTIFSNPSNIGGGYSVFSEYGELLKTKRIEKTNFTNNEAELLGLLSAVRIAKDGDEIITDSKNSIAWVNRGFAKARPDLNEKVRKIVDLVKRKNLKITWERRESNLAGNYNESLKIEPQWKQSSKLTEKKEQSSSKETPSLYQIPLF